MTPDEWAERERQEELGLREPHVPLRVHLARLTYFCLWLTALGFLTLGGIVAIVCTL